MQNNAENQYKHIYSLYIGNMCELAFPMTCDFIHMWLNRERSIAMSFALLGQIKHLWIVFSFMNMEYLQCAQVGSYLDNFAYISR